MKKLIYLLFISIFLFSCEEEEPDKNNSVKITGTIPKNGSVVKLSDKISVSVEYNIIPGELEMDGFYVTHYYRIDDNFSYQTDISTTKRLSGRSGKYSHDFYLATMSTPAIKNVYYHVKLYRKKSATSTQTLDISNEFSFKIDH